MNPFDILKNSQAIKEQVSKVQEELKLLEVTGSSGGGIVKVTMNGHFEIKSVYLDPIVIDPREIPMIQDLIVAASHDAMTKIKEQIESKLGSFMGNAGFPNFSF